VADRRPRSRERAYPLDLDEIVFDYHADVRQLPDGRWVAEVREGGSVVSVVADDPDTALREANASL
jgi:hypothetical protein